jgi:hypothetical protein
MDPYLVSIRRFLREEVMGFLALCALTSALAPLFFPTGAAAAGWLAARVAARVHPSGPAFAVPEAQLAQIAARFNIRLGWEDDPEPLADALGIGQRRGRGVAQEIEHHLFGQLAVLA